MLTNFEQPAPLVKRYLDDAPSGNVLDVGCEHGRNSLYLSRRGWQVTAIDTYQPFIDELSLAAEIERLPIQARCIDITNFQPPQTFDAIVCLMMLHFLTPETIKPALARLQALTKPGGINLISALTTANAPGTRPYLIDPVNLQADYAGWEIDLFETGPTSWIQLDDEAKSVRYQAVRLVARRQA